MSDIEQSKSKKKAFYYQLTDFKLKLPKNHKNSFLDETKRFVNQFVLVFHNFKSKFDHSLVKS